MLYFHHKIQRAADAAVSQPRNLLEAPLKIFRGAIRANLEKSASDRTFFLYLRKAITRHNHTEARHKPLTSAAEREVFPTYSPHTSWGIVEVAIETVGVIVLGGRTVHRSRKRQV